MTRAKISEYSATANDNTDVNGINIAEGCPPSSMNNMGREIMAALKRFQVGSDGDGVTVGGSLVVSGSTSVNTFNVDVISEKTSAAGVTVDGVLLKDGGLNTSGQVVFNDAGADVDFRVEGDTDANLVFVDASTDRVGVGTNSPAYKFDVNGQIRGDTFVRATSGSVGTFIVANSAGFGVVGTPTNHPLVLSANDIERARVTTDGYLRMASGTGGIQFGGDTAAANALDDYEEGTFTPTAVGSSPAGTATYSVQVGRYTKIGNRVFFMIYLSWSSGTGGGSMNVSNLPFTSSSVGNNLPVMAVGTSNLALPSNTICWAYVNTASNIVISSYPAGGGAAADVSYDASAAILLSGHYEVA